MVWVNNYEERLYRMDQTFNESEKYRRQVVVEVIDFVSREARDSKSKGRFSPRPV